MEVRTLLAGEFNDLGGLLPGVKEGSIAWGDSDNDGDFDALVTGTRTNNAEAAFVFRNDGGAGFNLAATLVGVEASSVAWGDMDQDGDLDIILTGRDSANVSTTKVYRNTGSNNFTDTNAAITGVRYSAVAWGDSDSDGDLDILITGQDASDVRVTKLYANNGSGTFTEALNTGLPGVSSSAVAWGDYNGDGFQDIALAGNNSDGTAIAGVFLNDGNNSFTSLGAGLTGVRFGSVAWGDYENDGDLDILLTGDSGVSNCISKIYRNNGNNTFTDINAGLTGVRFSSAAWGDYDQDGRLDVLLTGDDSVGNRTAKIYVNKGVSFADLNAGLTGVNVSTAAWIDIDTDGDLDIAYAGGDAANTAIQRVYRNNNTTANTAPAAPTNLTATPAVNNSVNLTWTAATDGQSPAAGLSYSLRVGTTPGGSDVFSTMANTATGVRRLPDAGPIQGTAFTLRGLNPTKTYYWSVQAIDTAFAGGSFATEGSFFVGPFTDLGTLGLVGVSSSSSTWGDMDNDGDLDVLLTGFDASNTRVAKVYRNNGNSTFTDLNAGLAGVSGGSVAWGDMDSDGDLDILLTGLDATNSQISKIYRNNGNSTFTDLNAILDGVMWSSVGWGDIDNDGDLDILLTGRDASNSLISKVYRNNGNNTFTDINAGLTGVQYSSVAWGDMDNDGDLDILLTGQDATNSLISKVYRNNGNSTFTDINAGLSGVSGGSVAWGDFDNDGDLDILLSGRDVNLTFITKVYRNNGNDSFTDINADLEGLWLGSVAWGDDDNDGDLDILLSSAKVYRNNGNSTFTDRNAGITGIIFGTVAWGDYDIDGDLDFLSIGRGPGYVGIAKIYRNNAATANTTPNAPTGLTATIASSTSLTFSWTPPAGDATPSAGLSYNLRVGTTPGASNVFSTMADTDANAGNGPNGRRRQAGSGPIQGTSYTLKNLTFGQTYYWSVQAVDTALAGSAFAAEKSIVVNHIPAIGAVANQPVNDNATVAPFATLTVTDPDNQNMLAKVTILNGAVRGDFTAASVAGWTRSTVGNDIIYSRFYNPAPNIGATVQAAIRALIFQPRTNAIKPNTTELTDFVIFINDGLANTSRTIRAVTTSVNDAPVIGGANPNVAANDNATVNPFTTLTVSEVDNQEMLISVTILNGVVRGDFTPASTANWAVRQVIGNNITYKRYFHPALNVGAAAQAAFRALVFQPRNNVLKPGTTEATDFQVTVSDGVAPAVLGLGTRVTTTSVNDVPVIGGAVANQAVNDNATKAVFSTLTITDPDNQETLARVTITNGVNRGDFVAGTTPGWTRTVSSGNFIYSRYFAPAANIGATVQAAIRAMVFQPRTNVPIGQTESTTFTVFINDGMATTTNSTTSVITTGVVPRPTVATPITPLVIREADISTLVLPSITKPRTSSLARLLKKAK